VIFIQPNLAPEFDERSENIRIKDEFGQQRIRDVVNTPGEVDREFSDEMNKDFEEWKANRLS
jgi:4-hydroxy-4-methyl-2-oxoglutarate aldolase